MKKVFALIFSVGLLCLFPMKAHEVITTDFPAICSLCDHVLNEGSLQEDHDVVLYNDKGEIVGVIHFYHYKCELCGGEGELHIRNVVEKK